MSLSDRDYYDEEERRESKVSRFNSWSAVLIVILLNVGLYFLNQLTGDQLFARMTLYSQTIREPLHWYQFLTYGFAHNPNDFMHILCNMLALFFLGVPVERRYGKREFLTFYLLAIVFSGVAWGVLNYGAPVAILGASGGVSAIVILFAFNYPRSIVYLMGIIPIPAWLLGVLFVVGDAYQATHGFDNIAHDAHLFGAAFACLYYLSGIEITRLRFGAPRRSASNRSAKSRKEEYRKFRLRTHSTPIDDDSTVANPRYMSFERLKAEVDRILKKYSETGKDSLTELERETLEYASEEYQKHKR